MNSGSSDHLLKNFFLLQIRDRLGEMVKFDERTSLG